ncbi:T-cell surface protein tactile isoform X2 [Hyaena hyaena]|uniref:T-cell surface protein tactile isoform X2 n=1 Tax=Hyaena hyaena TaxID=95912 RepID=UPI00192135D8|nr:T-cell surface protein tactile isoform X2 [Hyaena hyaena]
MEKKWTYCAVCSIIQIHFVRGVWGKAFNEEDIYAFPGSDVNLTCQTWKKNLLVQMQWSKVTDKLDLIALYHPQYGLYCASNSPCESLVTFTETPRNVSKWTLHLRNVSSSFTGKYECSFTLFPEGVQTKIYNLLIPTNVTQDEWRSDHIIEVQINQTLEIPCFQNISSEISSEFTFAWLVRGESMMAWRGAHPAETPSHKDLFYKQHVQREKPLFLESLLLHPGEYTASSDRETEPLNARKIQAEGAPGWLSQEDNGTQEAGITQGHSISNSTPFKDRAQLDTGYKLNLSPVQIHDDGRKFTCHVMVRPGKILKSSTTVKVFAKPEIPMIMENNSTDVLGERTFTCSLRNVFPTANLTWFIEGGFPQGEEEEVYITNEERKDKSGFWELKSVLKRGYGNKPAQSNNLTVWCMAVSPVPGNKVWNISSEKITFSLGSMKPPADPLPNVVTSTLATRTSPANSVSPTRYPATSSTALGDVGISTPNTTPQTSSSSATTQGLNYSWTSGRKDTNNSPWMPSETDSSSPAGAGSTIQGDIFNSTTRRLSEVPTTAKSTKNSHIHITGIVVNKTEDGMSWPVIVAALLSFCVALFGLGVRKWCQYQKEIMERPPPFKPPPPPIKYTCIQEAVGRDLPCQEMETL